MRGISNFTTLVRIAAVATLAMVSGALVMKAPVARAQETDSCPVASAGSAVSDLSGGFLGTLEEDVTPIDCDDDLSLVHWGDGYGTVSGGGVKSDTGSNARANTPDCGGAADGVICKAKTRIESKIEEWRRRYGAGHPKKK